MREFHAIKKQQANWKKTIHSKWFLLFLCICIFFISRGLFRVYSKYKSIKNDYQSLKLDVDNLEKREKELDTYIKRIDSDEGKDYEIRKKLDVSKPKEKTLYIIDKP